MIEFSVSNYKRTDELGTKGPSTKPGSEVKISFLGSGRKIRSDEPIHFPKA